MASWSNFALRVCGAVGIAWCWSAGTSDISAQEFLPKSSSPPPATPAWATPNANPLPHSGSIENSGNFPARGTVRDDRPPQPPQDTWGPNRQQSASSINQLRTGTVPNDLRDQVETFPENSSSTAGGSDASQRWAAESPVVPIRRFDSPAATQPPSLSKEERPPYITNPAFTPNFESLPVNGPAPSELSRSDANASAGGLLRRQELVTSIETVGASAAASSANLRRDWDAAQPAASLPPDLNGFRPLPNSGSPSQVWEDRDVRTASWNAGDLGRGATRATVPTSQWWDTYKPSRFSGALPGVPVTLEDALQQTSPEYRKAMIASYWKTFEQWGHWVDIQNRQAWLQRVAARVSQPQAAAVLNSALVSSAGHLSAASNDLQQTQQALGQFLSYPPGAAGGFVPADIPLVAEYETHYEWYAARNQLSREHQGIDRTLEQHHAMLVQLGQAVEASQAALEQVGEGNDVALLLQTLELWSQSRRAWLAEAVRYNQVIANYSLDVSPWSASPTEIASMLVLPDRPAIAVASGDAGARQAMLPNDSGNRPVSAPRTWGSDSELGRGSTPPNQLPVGPAATFGTGNPTPGFPLSGNRGSSTTGVPPAGTADNEQRSREPLPGGALGGGETGGRNMGGGLGSGPFGDPAIPRSPAPLSPAAGGFESDNRPSENSSANAFNSAGTSQSGSPAAGGLPPIRSFDANFPSGAGNGGPGLAPPGQPGGGLNPLPTARPVEQPTPPPQSGNANDFRG